MSHTPSTSAPGKLTSCVKHWVHRHIFCRRWLTFVVMGLAFFAFGAGTLNLFNILSANGSFLVTHGWQAVLDGGLWQLLEILLTGYASLLAYVLFKACEYRLTYWLNDD